MHWTRALHFLAMTRPTTSTQSPQAAGIHWFRKGLRLTDNLALQRAVDQNPKHLYPLYILDGDSYSLKHCTALRANFLVETLQDLDRSLRARGSRLFVASGDPTEILPELWKQWDISFMTYEGDESGEPYAHQRDAQIEDLASKHKIETHAVEMETIFPLQDYMKKCNQSPPITMGSFQGLFRTMGAVPQPIPMPESLPPIGSNHGTNDDNSYAPPKRPTDLPWPRETPKDQVVPLWGPQDCKNLTPIVHGGETLALRQLESMVMARPTYVATFEKPKTSCTETRQIASTTVLSPYLSWGCLSPRTVWHAIGDAMSRSNATPSKPPVSLQGQMLWRDFNNLMAHDSGVGNWNVIRGNKYCRPIPWDDNPDLVKAWQDGQTGYPWIDACMMQLKQEGWIHHLGRHAVACFLTRGDLWQSWEQGALHFESHLLDADYALNGFNWLWLSCSGFFYQYFRCYSPIAFQKKNDPTGKYIRKYLPRLAKLPDKYIYEPWKAPIAVQKTAGIKIGVDYPRPIVDHASISKENMNRMKEIYDALKAEKENSATGRSKKDASSSEPKKKKHKQTKLKF